MVSSGGRGLREERTQEGAARYLAVWQQRSVCRCENVDDWMAVSRRQASRIIAFWRHASIPI